MNDAFNREPAVIFPAYDARYFDGLGPTAARYGTKPTRWRRRVVRTTKRELVAPDGTRVVAQVPLVVCDRLGAEESSSSELPSTRPRFAKVRPVRYRTSAPIA